MGGEYIIMAFRVVYSRHYWDHEDSWTISQTIYRNVPYSELFKMKDAIPSLKENADLVYADYESKEGFQIDPEQFISSEVFIVMMKNIIRHIVMCMIYTRHHMLILVIITTMVRKYHLCY